MARRPQQQSAARRFYEFAGYLADIHCGLTLRAQGKSTTTDYEYYRDTARERRIPCPSGGHLMLRSDLVRAQFGDMLKSLILPDNWREEIRRQMIVEAQNQGILLDSVEKEKERLKLKRTRILKQHREGYIDDDEFHAEIAAVELALHQLQTPVVNGVKFDDVIAAGEHIPGMAALWDDAAPEERREMVMLLLEPGGLYYDLELKIIAALKPRPAFLPILRMLQGVVEYDEAKGIIVTENWQDRNRRASDNPQDTQRDRQTEQASSSSARLAILLMFRVFRERMVQLASTGIELLKTPYHAPRANAICERFLGSVRRECLDHLLLLQEKQLQRVLNAYVHYFNQARPHQGIQQQIPVSSGSTASPPHEGIRVVAVPILAGLHHDYRRVA